VTVEKPEKNKEKTVEDWTAEAWRRAGYTPFNRAEIVKRAEKLASATPAVLERQQTPDTGASEDPVADKKNRATKKQRNNQNKTKGKGGAKKKGGGVSARPGVDARPTESSEKNKYLKALEALGLHEEMRFPFVAGHCFFSSTARASCHFDRPDGAHIVRSLLGKVYEDPSWRQVLRCWPTVTLGMQCDEVKKEAERRGETISIFPFPNPLREWWLEVFFDSRANMMKKID